MRSLGGLSVGETRLSAPPAKNKNKMKKLSDGARRAMMIDAD
jgi:hypothetical protein